MKKRNVIGASLLAVFVCFQVSSCALPFSPKVSFSEYVDGLPAEMIDSTSMDIHYVFNDPTAYGFEDALLELPVTTKEDYQDSKEWYKTKLSELKQYRRSALSEEEQLLYDVLKDSFERSMLTLPYYELDCSYLGSTIGFQAQLPFVLCEFTIQRQQDLESYFNLLETAGAAFAEYADIEEGRQKAGVGMSRTTLKDAIEQCATFAANGAGFMAESFDERIDQTDFLTQEEKEAAKKRDRELLETAFVPAYEALGERLAKLDAPREDLGLSALKRGKDYYQALVKQQTGCDWSILKIRTYLDEQLDGAMEESAALAQKDQKAYRAFLNGESAVYTDAASAEEALNRLSQSIQRDFPSLGEAPFVVRQVPDALKENSSPAFYLVPPVDKPADSPQIIYLNGDYEPGIFSTLVHEGYPGHLYQQVFYRRSDAPLVRKLLNDDGYSEGWATYVENKASRYADEPDGVMLALNDLNTRCSQYISALADIGIHYQGWDRDEFYKKMCGYYGDGVEKESCNEMYDWILESPGAYVKYYFTALLFENLYEEAESKLGSRFDAADFHEALLMTGPTSFKILDKQMEKYIDAAG